MGQRSLRQIFTGMTFIGLIPMAVLLGLLVFEGQMSARYSAYSKIKGVNGALATQFGQILMDAEMQLQSLNGVAEVAKGDRQSCNAWFRANMPKRPGIDAWGRLSPDGTITCSSRPIPQIRIPDAAFDVDDSDVYDIVRFVPARTSATTGNTIIAIVKAYWNDGDPYQMVSAIEADWFLEALRQYVPDGEYKAFILDQRGNIILHLPDYTRFAGKAVPTFKGLLALDRNPQTHSVSRGIDGAERIVSSVHMHAFQGGGKITLSLSGDPDAVFATANTFIALGVGTLVLAIIGVILAQRLLFERYFAHSLSAILDFAKDAEQGETQKSVILPKNAAKELLELGDAISAMSSRTAERSAALSEALANLERAQGIANMGHWRLDVKTQDLQWSDGVYKLHQLDRSEFTPSLDDAIRFYHPDDRNDVLEAIQKCLDTGEPYEFEKRVLRADGSFIYISARGQVALDDEGSPVTMFGIIIDVDAPKQAQREMKRAQLAAQQLADARATFLATVSHEVRTPLAAMQTIIAGFDKSNLSTDQVDQVGLLDISGQLLMNVICDLLDSASADTGVIRLVEAPATPQAVIDHCYSTFKTAYTSDSISFYQETTGTEPGPILLDQQRLRQVIFNLIGNAVKHTPRGEIGIITTYGKDHLSLTVRDTGPGIAKLDQIRIFERFIEGVDKASRKSRGTGLGLYIVKTLVERMGGTVSVQSDPGEGSRFTIELPYRYGEQKETLSDKPDFRGEQPAREVLVVEDNPVNQKLIMAFLKRAGFDYIVQNDGQYAVEWLLAQPQDALPPIALIDVNMPRMNGIELCEFIRQQLPGGDTMPLYLVTADIIAEYDSEMSRLGIDGYISKPIDFAAMKRLLEKHVEPRAAIDAA